MPPFPFAGELAALATSIFFSIAPTLFTLSVRLVGPQLVNRTRLLIATIILMIIHTFIYGGVIPWLATPAQWQWLALSGLIGLTLGDAALFQAFANIGARLSMLIFSLAPILGSILGWLLLAEELSAIQILGIGVTLTGVVWVVSEQQAEGPNKIEKRTYTSGLFLATLAAMGQAGGLIAAKLGLANLPVLSGQVIRMLAATIVIWAWALLRGQGKQTIARLREKPLAGRYILLASVFGPVIGVWFSLAAVKYAEVGVASTLMSLTPIFLIPIGYFFFREKVSARAIVGTIVALAGVAILFLA